MHPVVETAGRSGELPAWAVCSEARRAHGIRVGDLLATWASRLDLPEEERVRWRAAGVLHDALKDASEAALVELAGDGWPAPVIHAPACALRLEADGVDDGSLLDAIRYHPVGHPDLDDLGQYLILADYLEPGRDGRSGRRSKLRDRLPEGQRKVLTVVVRQRLEKLLGKKRPLLDCSVEFWNRLVGA